MGSGRCMDVQVSVDKTSQCSATPKNSQLGLCPPYRSGNIGSNTDKIVSQPVSIIVQKYPRLFAKMSQFRSLAALSVRRHVRVSYPSWICSPTVTHTQCLVAHGRNFQRPWTGTLVPYRSCNYGATPKLPPLPIATVDPSSRPSLLTARENPEAHEAGDSGIWNAGRRPSSTSR
jgi:hypothetical protein